MPTEKYRDSCDSVTAQRQGKYSADFIRPCLTNDGPTLHSSHALVSVRHTLNRIRDIRAQSLVINGGFFLFLFFVLFADLRCRWDADITLFFYAVGNLG